MNVYDEHQSSEMMKKIGQSLRDWRSENLTNFTGLVHVSVQDLQSIADVMAERDGLKYKKVPRRVKVHHGYQARIFGVRVLADMNTPQGCVEMEGS